MTQEERDQMRAFFDYIEDMIEDAQGNVEKAAKTIRRVLDIEDDYKQLNLK